jgi:energy-converting hydrogenase Eha subunit F
MKKFFLFIYMIAIVGMTMAHDAHYDRLILRDWYLPKEQKNIKGSLYLYKDNKVFIEDINAKMLSIPFSSLCLNCEYRVSFLKDLYF